MEEHLSDNDVICDAAPPVSQGQTAPKQAPCVRLGLAPLKEGKKIEALTHLKLIAVVLVKRWFPVNSCSKFRFLTESSRLL